VSRSLVTGGSKSVAIAGLNDHGVARTENKISKEHGDLNLKL